MSWEISFIIILLIVFLMLLSSQWVAFALGTAGIVGIYLYDLTPYLNALGSITFNNVNSYTLTAVPMFIFLGNIILNSGISEKFYRGIVVFIGKLSGGLLHSNILACAFFSAISGSSAATTVAIGSVAIPEQLKQGYSRRMIYGSIGGGGTLGILIPPSIPLIVYGVLAQESIAKLFMAGLLPGIMIAVFFMIYIYVASKMQKDLAPRYEAKITWPMAGRALLDMIPVLVFILVIIGGIYWGVFTPTEAAAVGSIIALVIAAAYRKLNMAMLVKSLKNSVTTSCMVLFVILGAQILSFLFVQTGINRALSDWIVGSSLSPAGFLLIMTLVYLVLGCLMEGISMIYLTLPILLPTIQGLGIDMIWFGIFMVILIEIAQITPPVGINLFVIQGISGEKSLKDIILGGLPFLAIMLFAILVLAVFPEIVLWLPSNMTMR